MYPWMGALEDSGNLACETITSGTGGLPEKPAVVLPMTNPGGNPDSVTNVACSYLRQAWAY